MKGVIIGAIVLCAALVGLGGYLATRDSGSGPRLVPLDPAYEARLEKGYWSKGPENAPVTLAEYADFQCPGCRGAYPVVAQAASERPETLRVEFHHFPLASIHNKANLSATAAEAAGRQGKFWEMHDRLFLNQTAWQDQTVLEFRKTLDGYAEAIGLNGEQFRRDLKDASILDDIERSIVEGGDKGVDSTPTLYLNGKEVELSEPPLTAEQLLQYVDEAAAQSKP